MTKGFSGLILRLQDKEEAQVLKKSVLKHFQHLHNSCDGNPKHPLISIITIAILVVLAAANGFASSFMTWISGISEKLNIELIHIDGRTTRGLYDREKDLKALHSLSAWISENGLVLAQQNAAKF